ncbi:sensor histidine kinase [Sulfuricurvum sp.]|uniref:sensor histidine kinase n=1 Tax=Sulfuricurvum sp. TaxID=2025608 RepID=UPI003C335889
MFLKTFKGRILAVSLGMTIVSVTIFGYGLASIYYHHMEQSLSRSLSFLINEVTHEHMPQEVSVETIALVLSDPHLDLLSKGGVIDDLRIELLPQISQQTPDRLSQSMQLHDGRYLTISSSTAKINEELIRMIISRWFFFLFGFVLTSGIIYFFIRLLFTPFNELVHHCLTCSDPDKEPEIAGGGVEIMALRDAISSLQQRISGLQKTQHDSMKALTHELKTPLAQLRLRIDIADQKGEWNPEAIVQAREEIDTIAEKITLILHATQRSEGMEIIHLKESVERWIEELKPLWQHRELHFELTIPETSAALLPKAPFERVTRILIENALNHACYGSTIYLRCDNGVFEIENPVCDRNTPIIHSTGVGLEIAKTLCDYYGWQLRDVQDEKHYSATLSLAASPSHNG